VKRTYYWLLLSFIIVAAIIVVAIPVYLIMPFKPQTDRALSISYALKSWSPIITIVTTIGAFALTFLLWRGARWWGRVLLLIALLLVLPPAWFARQNHFEWMFNPLGHSAYTKVGGVNFIAASDMVLAVKINNEAVAYPVRLMAYHHVVEDIVGGTPICATY
jgi:uncharacterized protein DUF3179